MAPAEPTAEAPKPKWKDPFVVAFLIGVVVLTALRFIPNPFLRAEPPLSTLSAWALAGSDGGAVSNESLLGHVVLLEFMANPCDARCVERQQQFGRQLDHTDDLGDAIRLVSVAQTGADVTVSALAHGRWLVASGDEAQLAALLGPLQAAWRVQLGRWQADHDTEPLLNAARDGWNEWGASDAGVAGQLQFSAIVLIDQQGRARGFWRDDAAGRGNAVNAARLLVRHPEATAKH